MLSFLLPQTPLHHRAIFPRQVRQLNPRHRHRTIHQCRWTKYHKQWMTINQIQSPLQINQFRRTGQNWNTQTKPQVATITKIHSVLKNATPDRQQNFFSGSSSEWIEQIATKTTSPEPVSLNVLPHSVRWTKAFHCLHLQHRQLPAECHNRLSLQINQVQI